MAQHKPVHQERVDAEAGLIACILLDATAMARVRRLLTGDEFVNALAKRVWDVCVGLFDSGKAIDMVSVLHCLPDDVLAHKFVHNVTETYFTTSALDTYVQLLRERAAQNRLRKAARLITTTRLSYHDMTKALQQALVESDAYVRQNGNDIEDYKVLSSKLEEVYNNRIQMTGGHAIQQCCSGIYDLDAATGGFAPGQLVYLAGYTSSGKSVLAQQIAEASAAHGCVLYESLEMTWEQLLDRSVARRTGINPKYLQSGKLTPEQRTAVALALTEVASLPVVVHHQNNFDLFRIVASIKLLHAERGLRMVIVDYITLIQQVGRSRREEISAISRTFKELAKELGIVIVLVSQLSRTQDHRSDKPDPRPSKYMLKESGDCENDADTILLVWRPNNYIRYDNMGVPIKPDRLERAMIVVDKQRIGPAPIEIAVLFDHVSVSFLPEQSGLSIVDNKVGVL